MIVSIKPPRSRVAHTIEGESEIIFYFPAQEVARSIIDLAKKSGALHFDSEDAEEEFRDNSFSNKHNSPELIISQSLRDADNRLIFRLINGKRHAITSIHFPESLITFDMDVKITGSSTGCSPAAARLKAKLQIEICDIADIITTQFAGKIGFFTGYDEMGAA
jgi:hypothetical protein